MVVDLKSPCSLARSAPVKLPATAVDALAGAIGEVAQILVLYPLDTVKVRERVESERGPGLHSAGCNIPFILGCTHCASFLALVMRLLPRNPGQPAWQQLPVTQAHTTSVPPNSISRVAFLCRLNQLHAIAMPAARNSTTSDTHSALARSDDGLAPVPAQVRCQASGETAVVVVRRLLRRGFNLQLLQKLYAGALGAAACAVVVGAVHFASYEGSRKAFLKLLAPNGKPGSSMSSSTSSGGGSSCCVDGGVAGSAAGDTTYLHNATCAAAGLGAEPGASSNHALAGDPNATHGSPAWRRTAATFAAAFFAAVATALVESPVELFRHNAQAGLVQPNFLREMVSTVRREGVGGLYWGFLPHCFEAWPHDMAELATYGTMREYQDSVQRQYGSRRHGQGQGPGGAAAGGERAEGCAAGGEGAAPLLAGLSPEVWDLATGAASGAAAVLVSMPFDTVKTYLQVGRQGCLWVGVDTRIARFRGRAPSRRAVLEACCAAPALATRCRGQQLIRITPAPA